MKVYASVLSRVMSCAGSPFFEDLPKEEKSEQAKEGTAAGEYLEHLLNGLNPIPAHAKNGVMFDNDMKFHAKGVVDNIRSLTQGEVNTEVCVDWRTRSGITIVGRYDASFVRHGELYVDDYKYGWGIVDVNKNWQLIAYAIGEIIRLNMAFNHINLRVHQPRPHHHDGATRTWRITYDELLVLKEEIEVRMEAIVAGERGLVTTENCKYCPAAAACPAFNKAWYRSVEAVHEFLQDDLSNEEIAFAISQAERMEDLLKTRKGSLEALAVSRIKAGQIIPGYSDEKNYGHRTWKPGLSPEAIKLMTGIDILEKVLLSPAKAEKIGLPKEFVATATTRPYLGTKLVKSNASEMADKMFGNPNKQGV